MKKIVNLIEQIKKDKKVRNTFIFGAGVTLLIVLVVFLIATSVKSPAYRVVDQYMKGMKTFDADMIMELYHEDIIDAIEEDDTDFEDELQDMLDEMEDGDVESVISYKIISYVKYTDDQLEQATESLSEYTDIDEDEVEEIRSYLVSNVLDEDNDENVDYINIDVVKIEGKWYLLG